MVSEAKRKSYVASLSDAIARSLSGDNTQAAETPQSLQPPRDWYGRSGGYSSADEMIQSSQGQLYTPVGNTLSQTQTIGSSTPAAETQANARTGSWYTDPNLWGAVIQAGAGLAQSYWSQSSNKKTAEQYAEQQAEALKAAAILKEKEIAAQKEIAELYSGATVKAAMLQAESAKKNTLANLYNNWAEISQKANDSEGEAAQNIGFMVGRSLDARQASLK
jgi:hypothetical protein